MFRCLLLFLLIFVVSFSLRFPFETVGWTTAERWSHPSDRWSQSPWNGIGASGGRLAPIGHTSPIGCCQAYWTDIARLSGTSIISMKFVYEKNIVLMKIFSSRWKKKKELIPLPPFFSWVYSQSHCRFEDSQDPVRWRIFSFVILGHSNGSIPSC